jgi:hypothetical protein
MTYKNIKTGNLYRYLAMASNASNDGKLMVVYCPCNNEHSIYVRNEDEFYEMYELC